MKGWARSVVSRLLPPHSVAIFFQPYAEKTHKETSNEGYRATGPQILAGQKTIRKVQLEGSTAVTYCMHIYYIRL